MTLTSSIISAVMPTAKKTLLPAYAYYLEKLPPQYGINTAARLAAFMAQSAHESGELREIKEKWEPSKYQLKYEGKKTLGNIYPGDGKKFLGRGMINITGRSNYEAFGRDMFNNKSMFTDNPALLEQPYYAVLSAIWFWNKHKLNQYADAMDFKKVTKVINPGMLHFNERYAYYQKSLNLLAQTYKTSALQ